MSSSLIRAPDRSGIDSDDLDGLADWIELSAAVNGEVLFADVSDALHDEFQDVGSGDDADLLSASDRERAERLAEEIWEEMGRRKKLGGRGFPLKVSSDRITCAGGIEAHPAYGMMLVADVGRRYKGAKLAIKEHSKAAALFENIVSAALQNNWGTSFRFGWPRDPGSSKSLRKHAAALAKRLNLRYIGADVSATDKDLGTDVVAKSRIAGLGNGSVVLLVQCAVGGEFDSEKAGATPSYTRWDGVVVWRNALLRATAVPWNLSTRSNLEEDVLGDLCKTTNGSLILDRLRICYMAPDRELGQDVADRIADWLDPRLSALREP